MAATRIHRWVPPPLGARYTDRHGQEWVVRNAYRHDQQVLLERVGGEPHRRYAYAHELARDYVQVGS